MNRRGFEADSGVDSGTLFEFCRLSAKRLDRRLFAPLSGRIPQGAKVGVIAPNQATLFDFFSMLTRASVFDSSISVEGVEVSGTLTVLGRLNVVGALHRGESPLEAVRADASSIVLLAYPERFLNAVEMAELSQSVEKSKATLFCCTLDRAILDDSVDFILELDPAFSRILRGNFSLWAAEYEGTGSVPDVSMLRRRLRRGEFFAPIIWSGLAPFEKQRLLEEQLLPDRLVLRLEETFGLDDWISVGVALGGLQDEESIINYLGFEEPDQLLSQASDALQTLGFSYADLVKPSRHLSREMCRRAAFVRAILLASGSPPLLLEYPELGTTLPFLNFVGTLLANRRSPTVIVTDDRWLLELFSSDAIGLEDD